MIFVVEIEYFIVDYFHYFKNVRKNILCVSTITSNVLRFFLICIRCVCSLSSLTAFDVTIFIDKNSCHFFLYQQNVLLHPVLVHIVRNKFISLFKIFAVYYSELYYFILELLLLCDI